MNAVITTLHTLLDSTTGSGGALESLANRIAIEAADVQTTHHDGFPRLNLRRAISGELDCARGSKFAIREGFVELSLETEIRRGPATAELDAREEAEDLRDALVSVLVTPELRARPDATWSRMSFAVGEGGPVLKTGNTEVDGIDVYRIVIGCMFKYMRRLDGAEPESPDGGGIGAVATLFRPQIGIVLAGTIDGVNDTFTFPHAMRDGSEAVYVGVVRQIRDAHYSVVDSTTIEFLPGFVPQVTDPAEEGAVTADYWREA